MVDVEYPYLAVELTGFCNLQCTHCIRTTAEKGAELEIALYKKLLDETRPYRFPMVSFTGGEPTLHSDFGKVLDRTDDAGLTFSLNTNGWNFADIYPVIAGHKSHLSIISFSLDGSTAEIHDRIRGRGSYERVLRAMSLCGAKGLPFNIQMAVHTINRDEMEPVAALGARMGAGGVSFLQTQLTRSNVENGLILSPDEWIDVETETARLDRIFSLKVGGSIASSQPSRWYNCPFLGMRVLNIDFRGNLTFCCQLSGYRDGRQGTEVIGNLRDHSFGNLHRLLIERLRHFQEELVDDLENTADDGRDYFPCFTCSRRFNKLDWIDWVDTPWARFLDASPPNKSFLVRAEDHKI